MASFSSGMPSTVVYLVLPSRMAHRTPDLLHGLIATAPLWALGLLAVVVGLAAVWAVIQLFESAWKGAKAIINTAKGRAAYE
jgi:hypothetical protein